MSANVVNQVSFLRTSRNFPEDLRQLTVEINKVYIDIANAVNERTISIFPTNRPAVNGESWFLSKNLRQQGLRQAYPFTTLPAVIHHGLNFDEIERFVRIFGAFTDGTFWYPLPYVAIVGGVASQVEVFLDDTNIFVTSGAGGPTSTKGTVILEWISDP